ncbi:hypothetical protein MATL_G00165810 [Megalops atlanticus]|uniref:protein-tyrosine-phosphatase n=1 Tax=Megalops atlanticus TaxID=7932 RepID=A0A9D3PQA2_MEGAT|nr:hypothetical protein MATL_G00165810 [Megalops atlanticus]
MPPLPLDERIVNVKGERGSVGGSRHSGGTVTLEPRQKHSHTIDIKLSLGRRGGATVPGKGRSGLNRSVNRKGSKEKKVSLHLDVGQGDRKPGAGLAKSGGAVQQLQNHPQNKATAQQGSHHHNQLCVSPGGVLGLTPAQGQHPKLVKDRDLEVPLKSYTAIASFPSCILCEVPCGGNKENSKLGLSHQLPAPFCIPHEHCSANVPHASSTFSTCYPALSALPSQAPRLFHQKLSQPRPSCSRERPPRLAHPASHSSSQGGGFPSPDHTCTLDLSHPLNCGCWRLIRCGRGGEGCGVHDSGGGVGAGFGPGSTSRAAGLKTLGGCLSNSSTTNTSSSNSTVSECRAGPLQPLGCVPCSEGGRDFKSPAAFRKKLVGGCLPCTPLSSSGPLRALQSCMAGCNPKASQTGSSTCSYCSSDPIIITYNPQRGKAPAAGQGGGRGRPAAAGFMADDDDYSVRTIWPEELAKKMTRSKAQQSHECGGIGGAGLGVRGVCERRGSNGSGGKAGPIILDCRNLLEFTRSQAVDHAGRHRLQQGRMVVLDFLRSGGSQDEGRESLKRLWTKEEEPGGGNANRLNGEVVPPSSPPPQSPPSLSPPSSAPNTLSKPKPRGREKGSSPFSHTLPSEQSFHLVLNSLNREQDEGNGKVTSDLPLLLPLSSSLPASLSEEGVLTPDVENAALSPILPFLFLGNERDAQDLDLLLRLGISYVVNVTTHLPLYHLATGLVHYKRLPATDSSKQNLRQYFEEVFEFIEEAHQSGRGVLVHCQAGVSRSATIVIAYLMKHTLMTMTDAYKYVRSRRPIVAPNLNFMGQLLEFERDLNSGVTPRMLTPKLSGLETQV